jgi:flavin-dependent dehydrogenase
LLANASAAGVDVRRGASVQHIVPGRTPKVVTEAPGALEELEARLVALCAGRNPGLRDALGFKLQRGTISLLLSGIWLHNLPAEMDRDVAYVGNDIATGLSPGCFHNPQSLHWGRAC